MKDYDTKKKGMKTYTCNKCTCTTSSRVQYKAMHEYTQTDTHILHNDSKCNYLIANKQTNVKK